MPKLEWDKKSEKHYETGVRNVVLFIMNSNGQYGAGIPWNGVTNVTETADGGDTKDLWADDIKYIVMRKPESRKGSIEAYTYPPEFGKCDGSYEVQPGIVLRQQPRTSFAICYRTVLGNDVEGEDYAYKLHIVYGCDATPTDRGYDTMDDDPDAITFSWDFVTTPVEVTGHKPTASIEIDSSKVDATKLVDLEEILYGTDNTDSRLPLPDEVLSTLS